MDKFIRVQESTLEQPGLPGRFMNIATFLEFEEAREHVEYMRRQTGAKYKIIGKDGEVEVYYPISDIWDRHRYHSKFSNLIMPLDPRLFPPATS